MHTVPKYHLYTCANSYFRTASLTYCLQHTSNTSNNLHATIWRYLNVTACQGINTKRSQLSFSLLGPLKLQMSRDSYDLENCVFSATFLGSVDPVWMKHFRVDKKVGNATVTRSYVPLGVNGALRQTWNIQPSTRLHTVKDHSGESGELMNQILFIINLLKDHLHRTCLFP